MQRSFEDLGTPLHEVTFVVFDVETTGTSPGLDAITELGAVKLRGGECLGTFQTLVNPGVAIPPSITWLTGITEAMVYPAPRISEVLPSFLEFAGGAVLVGHNVRFDLRFVGAALREEGYGALSNRFVDTCALSRRLLADELPDHRLHTLADRLRLHAKPTHRALDDALATGELLHYLLERAGTFGVLGLDDLLELPTVRGHPQLSKLSLTSRLPRKPGIYIFKDVRGRSIYVGKAVDLRRRVRSYFTSETRRKVPALLREVHSIDHRVCHNELEAAVWEVRLIQAQRPRYNSAHKGRGGAPRYVALTLEERFPRLSIVQATRPGRVHLGPVPTFAAARELVAAIETALPLRRCTRRSLPEASSPCAPAQLGVACCPCSGETSEADYADVVSTAMHAFTTEPNLIVDQLVDRMHKLSRAERFEDAAVMRDRAEAVCRLFKRQRRLDLLRNAGRLTLQHRDGDVVTLESGRLSSVGTEPLLDLGFDECAGQSGSDDELAIVATWLEQNLSKLRVIWCDGEFSSPITRVPQLDRARRNYVAHSSGSVSPTSPVAPSSPIVASPSYPGSPGPLAPGAPAA